MRRSRPRRVIRAGLLAAGIAAASMAAMPTSASAQVALTDGWSIFVYGGVTYLIPPGYTHDIVEHPDGSTSIHIVPISPPPPPPPPWPPGGVLVSKSGTDMTTGAIEPGVRTTTGAPVQAQATPLAHGGTGDSATGAASAHPIAFTRLHESSRRALVPFLDQRILDQLDRDAETVYTVLLELTTEQRIDAAAFNALRSSALRLRGRLPDVLTSIESGANQGRDDEQARMEALEVVAGLVAGLETLLPLLDAMETQAHLR